MKVRPATPFLCFLIKVLQRNSSHPIGKSISIEISLSLMTQALHHAPLSLPTLYCICITISIYITICNMDLEKVRRVALLYLPVLNICQCVLLQLLHTWCFLRNKRIQRSISICNCKTLHSCQKEAMSCIMTHYTG